jgi:hypothetical protein
VLLGFRQDGLPKDVYAQFDQLLLPDGISKLATDANRRSLVLGGSPSYPSNTITRVTPERYIDQPYGDEGTVELMPGRQLALTTISTNRRGAALVTGSLDGTRRPLVFRLLPSGSTNPRFGKSGHVVLGLRLGGKCGISAATNGGGGRLLVAGVCGRRLFVARMGRHGHLDPRFGTKGVFTPRIGRPASATGIALQGNRVLVSGWAGQGKGQKVKVILARLTSRGHLDRDFGVRGFAKAGATVRRGGCGTREEASILVERRRIVLVRDGSGRPVLGFGPNGGRDRSYAADPAVAAGRYVAGDCFPGPFGALQTGKPLLTWTLFAPPHPRPRIALQRLEP